MSNTELTDGKHTNTLYTGDNLYIMHGMNSESVDLIYLDPPFNSKRLYSAPAASKAAGASFKDTWTWQDVDEAYLENLIDNYPYMIQFIKAVEDIYDKSMMAYLTYMSQRIIEMHRILKPTGSLYLHCDPTASHYLKIVLDKVFGSKNFRNEIIWQRTIARKGNLSRGLACDSDTILRYSKSDNFVWNSEAVTVAYDLRNLDEKTKRQYTQIDKEGRLYRLTSIESPKQDSSSRLTYTLMGVTKTWRWKKDRMMKAVAEGRVVQTKPWNVPRQIQYLDEQKGKMLNNIWTDIALSSQAKERTGYPTQKPLALLHRIIKASSNEGDVVLDPFCGCGTTMVAAQQLDRKWIAIDIKTKAADIVVQRLSDDAGLFKDMIHRNDLPQRTDVQI